MEHRASAGTTPPRHAGGGDDSGAGKDSGTEGRGERAGGMLARAGYALGGAGLLGATLSDSLAVAGRHTGFRLLGSIELVQAMVVLLGSAAMLIATLTGNHASVHIVTARLTPGARDALARVANLFAAATFAVLAGGSAWVLADLWGGYEQTELLHIPLRWLRLLWVLVALLIAGIFARRALRGHA